MPTCSDNPLAIGPQQRHQTGIVMPAYDGAEGMRGDIIGRGVNGGGMGKGR
jgi:hypothetical protein